mmetsp:Transcript_102489/g.142820  ORF Transcript_102489/g.142820 Transcript_102489/m.142820 type:complete len:225 (-) Transcript_102489:618-1292(-)
MRSACLRARQTREAKARASATGRKYGTLNEHLPQGHLTTRQKALPRMVGHSAASSHEVHGWRGDRTEEPHGRRCVASGGGIREREGPSARRREINGERFEHEDRTPPTSRGAGGKRRCALTQRLRTWRAQPTCRQNTHTGRPWGSEEEGEKERRRDASHHHHLTPQPNQAVLHAFRQNKQLTAEEAPAAVPAAIYAGPSMHAIARAPVARAYRQAVAAQATHTP